MNPTLELNFSDSFGYPLKLQFTPWHAGVSWISAINGKQYLNEYYEDRGLSLEFLIHQPESETWKASIPHELLTALLRFEKSFLGHTFACLWFTSRSKHAAELLLSSPRVMWTAIDYAKRFKVPSDEALNLFSEKRTQLLALHELPPKKFAIRFLEKYETDQFNLLDLNLIRSACNSHTAHQLGRITRVTQPVLKWLNEVPDAIHYKFLSQITKNNADSTKSLVEDTLYMGRLLRVANISQQLNQCADLRQLNHLHDRLVAQLNRGRGESTVVKKRIFDAPPFEDSDTVIAIKNAEELLSEGISMSHCIYAYKLSIEQGEYFAYKVLEPERATLGLKFKNHKWQIDQIRLRKNRSVSDETKDAVYWWLENQRL